MSSLFTTGEIALADLGLADLTAPQLDVVVGGLGLGYTAQAALAHPNVNSMLVIEALAPVIDWHKRHVVPLGQALSSDSRCRLIQGDFFALARDAQQGFDPQAPQRRFHAILLDIDHSPRHILHPDHAAFYTPAGLRQIAAHLYPGGVFAQWSNDAPDKDFLQALNTSFATAQAHVVTFHNPLQNREATCTIYVGRRT